MLDVKIKYDEPTSSWGTQFKEALDENGIIYDEQMILNICRSLDNTVCDFLYANGYKPRPNLSYRVGLIKRLRKNGLTLSITTNYVFWKYLEYFTDITDYSKCFNIKIEIENLELATKDLIFVSVNTDHKTAFVEQPTLSEEYTKVKDKLNFLRGLVDKDADKRLIKHMLNHIIDLVDYLFRRTD